MTVIINATIMIIIIQGHWNVGVLGVNQEQIYGIWMLNLLRYDCLFTPNWHRSWWSSERKVGQKAEQYADRLGAKGAKPDADPTLQPVAVQYEEQLPSQPAAALSSAQAYVFPVQYFRLNLCPSYPPYRGPKINGLSFSLCFQASVTRMSFSASQSETSTMS